MAEAEAQIQVEYWCHHCDKRVSVESVGVDEPDLICSDCKFGFVESISSSAASVPVVVDDDHDDIDQPTLGSQFLQVLRLLAQVSNDDHHPQPPLLPQPPQLPSSDPNDLLRIQIDHLIQDDENDVDDDDDDDDDESVRSVEIQGGDSDTDEEQEDEEDALRRQRRDLLRLRLRDFATRARTGAGRNRILDWADILMGLDNYSNSNSRDPYVGNPGDYVNDAEYEALLQNLADSEGRRGAPPASKAAVDGLNSLHINDEQASFVCAVCKESVSVGEVVKEMPCTHAYHTDCILPWLAARNTCPVCRFQLPTDDPDYDHNTTTATTTVTTSASSTLPNSSSSTSSASTF